MATGPYGTDADHPIIEAMIGGVWTDISDRVRNEQRVTIRRGRASEQGRVGAQRADLTLDDSDGFFNGRNPSSVNYGAIGKNTRIRVRAGSGDNYLRTLFNDLNSIAGATTADKASLDVTGDIDLRADITPHTWRPYRPLTLAAKYDTTGNQRSWDLRLRETGKITLTWSPDGTSGAALAITSGTAITPPTGMRLAVRVTLDVNNGAGGHTATFYTAPDISGPWTALGSPTTVAGTTSIFASTATLGVARGSVSYASFVGSGPFGGKVHRFQIYNGIGGTLVADFDPDDTTIGGTSFSDGLASPNTWTIAGSGARITSDRVRFVGELSALPRSWDVTGTDVTVRAQASGLLRRLGQGRKPLQSAMFRNFNSSGISSYGWWPLEDGNDAAVASNSGAGVEAVLYQGTIASASFGASDSPPGAASSLAFSGSGGRLTCRAYLKAMTAPATYSLVFYVRMSALPASDKVFCTVEMFGQLARIEIAISSTAWSISFYNIIGTLIASSNTAVGLINPSQGWIGYNLLLKDSGVNDMTYSQRWDTIGTFGGGVGPTTIVGFQPPPPNAVKFTAQNDAAFNDMKLSHVFLSNEDFDLTNDTFRDASNAYNGEPASVRLARLAAEEGEAIELVGITEESEPMGYQGIKTYPDLVAECWDVDGGVGGDARDELVLSYRTRADLENRSDLTLDYSLSDLAEVPEPIDDDQGVTNDVTVRRAGGSFARAIVVEGRTSVQEPPDGIGRYETEVTLSVADDDRLPSIAGWLALVGAWDADRYPSVIVALHRSRLLADSALFNATMAVDIGDTVILSSLPSWMPPDDIPELVQGTNEQLSRHLWQIEYTATPAGPYRAIPILGSDLSTPRLDATEHTTGGALTTTATSVSLVTPAGSAVWVDSATYPSDFPMDLVIGGEVVTLTAVTGTSSPQTGTLTRSVNGVVKAHSSGAAVRLANPFYVGR